MSVKKPSRTFTGAVGEASTDNKGPAALITDIDTINKMFDPSATHTSGEEGGISQENLNFDLSDIGSLASVYSSSSTYSVGDFCMYGGKLYKCTTAISTAEEWNSEHWTSQVAMNVVKAHTDNTENPHSVTKAHVGLGNCDNTADEDKTVNKVGHSLTFGSKTFDGSEAKEILKSDIGLSNVDNKSEATIKSDLTGSIVSGNTNFATGGDVYTQLATKENLSNKVTSFQATPDDTHYPSEKLTKDSLDLKESLSNKVTSFQSTTDNTHYPSEKLVKDSLDLKAPKASPEFTGSISLGRKANTTIGDKSFAVGNDVTASGTYSHSEGWSSVASGSFAHAEGYATYATQTDAHAEGYYTTASSPVQHAQGKYNVEDSSSIYADIIGNGSANNARKNIEATTWTGDKRLKGDVYVGCNDDSTGGNKLESTANLVTSFQSTPDDTHYPSEKLTKDSLDAKQATLVSGTNIKTINNLSLLGSGNITIGGGGGSGVWGSITGTLSDQTDLNTALTGKQDVISDLSTIRSNATAGAAKQSKPTYNAELSISSSTGWTNNTYTTLNTTYPFASYDIEVSISPDATSTQRDAYAEAMFTGHSNSNYITALGTKPTVDIPIVIRIWSKA